MEEFIFKKADLDKIYSGDHVKIVQKMTWGSYKKE